MSCVHYFLNGSVISFTVQNLENPESMMIYYVMLRGVDKFQAEYNSYPGEFDDQVEPDIVKLKVPFF